MQNDDDSSEFGRTFGKLGAIGKRLIAEQIDQRASLIAGLLSDASIEVIELGDDVRKRGRAVWLADALDYVAANADKAAGYLERSDGTALAHDYERYAREKPAIVAGAGLFFGFAVSRLLRVSTAPEQRPTIAA